MANEDYFHLGLKAMISDPEGRVLLLQVNLQELSGYKGDAYWDIPGGRIHRGGSIVDTLKREVAEETGIEWDGSGELLGAALSNIRIPVDDGDVGLILFVYRCRLTDRPEVKLSSEHVAFKWMDSEEAAAVLETKYPKEFTELVRKM